MVRRRTTTREQDESNGQTLSTDSCPDCAGTLRTDGGETRCESCGLIVEACRLDRRGKRIFDDDERTERTGKPLTPTRHDRGLSTEIGQQVDANGNTLSGSKQRQLNRLRREHTRAKWRSKAERNLAHGLSEVARLTSELDVAQSLREQASSLFRTAHDEDLCRGRSIEAIATGSVYAACRLTEVTRTLEEIVAVARVDRSRITNAYGTLNRELALPTPPQEPAAFIPSIASTVEVPARTEHRARELASKAATAGVAAGRHPAGFAAACLEVAAELTGASVTQVALAEAADVDPVTVRKHRETIRATLDG